MSKIKIFSTADIHGDKVKLEKIVDFINRRNDIEVVVFCGDLASDYSYSSIQELTKLQRMDYIFFKESIEKIKQKIVYYIKGNHDVFLEDLQDLKYLRRAVKANIDYKLIPFEMMSIDFYRTNREGTEEDIRNALSEIDINSNSIIIAHQPPYVCTDRSSNGYYCGSSAIKEMILFKKPLLYISGHIHDGFGIERIKDTLVVNCACSDHIARDCIIDVETKACEKVIL